ncbi:DUF3027 domain-containing protein [Bifidobacterium samirii]|uniref:DUF3027 domain-containing protein n=1 Tax=Bifidobacterium samirii TaxID=2306974 RepID=A0A430FPC2_9BIFI|nr:DUF3027 domain-containing protein [Bifidobacterium samirii]RSX54679.1 hypothetical protein D2E24_1449 [Bifidobacterium samirii]
MPDTTMDPIALAREIAIDTAETAESVGDLVAQAEAGDHVTDFRFACLAKGYEGWQWSVTLYHDDELDRWTVNESSLLPTDEALRPPAWIPWKDRLEPTDLSVTDSIGTDPDDPRMEPGFRRTVAADTADGDAADGAAAGEGDHETPAGADNETATPDGTTDMASSADAAAVAGTDTGTEASADGEPGESGDGEAEPAPAVTSEEDVDDAVRAFDLSRRHVLTPLGRAQAAKRWYEGPHGPKALSTKTAAGNACADCGFFVPLTGELGAMFGVCANKWSPDDGRVVSMDHGCGEHSEIEPPEPTPLWVQSKPAYDDLHIDIVEQLSREELAQIELIERLTADGIEIGRGVIVLRSQLPRD